MTLRRFIQLFFFTYLINDYVLADCPDGAVVGWTEQGSAGCYFFERFPAQFVTAERLCRDSNGHLASVPDLSVNTFIAETGVEVFDIMQTDNFWIGGDDLEKKNSWKWSNGANFDYNNWADKEPVDDGRSFCTAIALDGGEWSARNCYEPKPYVCEVPQIANSQKQHSNKTAKHGLLRPNRHQKPNKLHIQSEPKCNKNWSYLPATDLCYKIVKDASDCYHSNTQEAAVHSKVINDFIGKLAQKESKSKNIAVRLSLVQHHPSKQAKKTGKQVKPWLTPNAWGLRSDSARQQFFKHLNKKEKESWFDGSAVDFKNWAQNEPKQLGEFTCAQLNTCHGGKCSKSSKFEWTSSDCLKAERAVCSQVPNY
jgi:hypothetical protein